MGLPEPSEFNKLLEKMFCVAAKKGFKTNITTGNCGSFAIALKRFFGEGELIRPKERGYAHVLLKKGEYLYDGLGVRKFNELLNELGGTWYEYFEGGFTNEPRREGSSIEEEIPIKTTFQNPPEVFTALLIETFSKGESRRGLEPLGKPFRPKICPVCKHKTLIEDKYETYCTACPYVKPDEEEDYSYGLGEN